MKFSTFYYLITSIILFASCTPDDEASPNIEPRAELPKYEFIEKRIIREFNTLQLGNGIDLKTGELLDSPLEDGFSLNTPANISYASLSSPEMTSKEELYIRLDLSDSFISPFVNSSNQVNLDQYLNDNLKPYVDQIDYERSIVRVSMRLLKDRSTVVGYHEFSQKAKDLYNVSVSDFRKLYGDYFVSEEIKGVGLFFLEYYTIHEDHPMSIEEIRRLAAKKHHHEIGFYQGSLTEKELEDIEAVLTSPGIKLNTIFLASSAHEDFSEINSIETMENFFNSGNRDVEEYYSPIQYEFEKYNLGELKD